MPVPTATADRKWRCLVFEGCGFCLPELRAAGVALLKPYASQQMELIHSKLAR
jgi:hypothetical protein